MEPDKTCRNNTVRNVLKRSSSVVGAESGDPNVMPQTIMIVSGREHMMPLNESLLTTASCKTQAMAMINAVVDMAAILLRVLIEKNDMAKTLIETAAAKLVPHSNRSNSPRV